MLRDARGSVNCPEEQQPRVVLDTFDAAADHVALDFGALFAEVDLARTEFDTEPEGAEPQITDPTITPYPMPDYYSGFFMDRIDGEGAVILKQLGIDWMSLTPPDPTRQVFVFLRYETSRSPRRSCTMAACPR